VGNQTPAGAAAERKAPVVELIEITKRYPGVVANDGVTIAFRAGEVHCLLGENGAGKSTLMGILSGLVKPDAGRIMIDGKDAAIDSPRAALKFGIGTVYQHSTLIPALTVLQNLMLGESRSLRLDTGGARRRLDELAGLLGVEIDPEEYAGDLALGRQQQVEIIKALWRGSRVLILDEPTSMLTPQAFAELEKVLARLKERALAIVFISHKLHEALSLGDRISVLRQGRLAGSLDGEALSSASSEELRGAIIRMMFGEEARAVEDVAELQEDLEVVEQEHLEIAEQEPSHEVDSETVLELDRASAQGVGAELGIEDVSFTLAAGEILGVAGVDGNGQRALAETISGQRHLTDGQILLYGVPISRLSVSAREKLGLRYVTDDRLGEGTVGSLSVALNLFLKRIGQPPFWRFGRIQRGAVGRRANELVREFDVRTPSVGSRVGTLSGGNIQKVVLARELAFQPKVVVFNKPTHGLDVRTTSAVRETIVRLAREGAAALVISTDLEELIEICDRIAVVSRGRLVGVVPNGPGAADEVGQLMVGELPAEAA